MQLINLNQFENIICNLSNKPVMVSLTGNIHHSEFIDEFGFCDCINKFQFGNGSEENYNWTIDKDKIKEITIDEMLQDLGELIVLQLNNGDSLVIDVNY
jgi:hypothetical protein